MEFSGKIKVMIILRVTKSLGFTLSLENKISEKPHKGGGIDLAAFLGLKRFSKNQSEAS